MDQHPTGRVNQLLARLKFVVEFQGRLIGRNNGGGVMRRADWR
jgi:hypothetical protein